MRIVADESVDFMVVRSLREQEFVVYSIAEEQPAISDEEVLKIAVQQQAVLITEDKDFGELVFRLKLPHCGIILLRLGVMASQQKGQLAARAILIHLSELQHAFSVFDGHQLRIRR